MANIIKKISWMTSGPRDLVGFESEGLYLHFLGASCERVEDVDNLCDKSAKTPLNGMVVRESSAKPIMKERVLRWAYDPA